MSQTAQNHPPLGFRTTPSANGAVAVPSPEPSHSPSQSGYGATQQNAQLAPMEVPDDDPYRPGRPQYGLLLPR